MQSKWLFFIVALIVGVIAFCMTYLMERRDVEIWTDGSKEAKLNPFLAAELFLKDNGTKVLKANDAIDFSSIPTNQTVLLTDVDSMLVTERQIDAALSWVNSGGYLIVGVGTEVQGQNSLLHRFDIEPELIEAEVDDIFLDEDGGHKTISERLRELNKKIDESEETQADETETPITRKSKDSDLLDLLGVDYKHEYYTLKVSDQAGELFVAVLDDIKLNHPNVLNYSDDSEQDYVLNAWGSDENGERLLQFYYGDGNFVAISSSRLWDNNNIMLGDHAYFLSYLVPAESTMRLFYNISSPPLTSILQRYFKEVLWMSIAFLLLWLWHRGLRVQRINEPENHQRREFSEHLRSSAEFLARHQQSSKLVQTLRDDIEQQMLRFYPNFRTLNHDSQAAILANETDVPQSSIELWLDYCKDVKNRDQLLTALQIGHAIRKKL